ncbi:hypothetical protein ABT301_12755 [Streptomyces sp. NPDC000987]|uniref:hypothetical protein n=1 Tax=Streptomyces sp. NPDC000987 TaxID=3154374 RepID=UPI00331EB044
MHTVPTAPSRRGPRRVAAALGLSLAALLVGCGPTGDVDGITGSGAVTPGAKTPGAAASTTAAGKPAGKVSAQLVGEWQEPSDYLTLGKRNLDIYDPQSGWPSDPDAVRAGSGIRITADGHYVWSGYTATNISGSACHSRALTYQRGRATQDGQTIILEPEINRQAYQGGCNSDSDMDAEQDHSPQRWGWQRTTDDQGRVHLKLVSVEKSHDYVLVTD